MTRSERAALLDRQCLRGHPRTPKNTRPRVTRQGRRTRICLDCTAAGRRQRVILFGRPTTRRTS